MRPANGASLKGLTQTVSATVTDSEMNLASSNIRLLVDGNPVAFTYNQDTDSLTSKLTFTAGSHTVTVEATDTAGNKGTAKTTFTLRR